MNIITGSGRSGTSFVAKIIDTLAGLSGTYRWENDVQAGMETKDVVDINKMLFFINGKQLPYSNQWLSVEERGKAKFLASSVLQSVAEHHKGKWVKDPLFSKTLQIWLDSGVTFHNVLICTRNPHNSMLSAKRVNRGFEPAVNYEDWQIEAEMHARQGYLYDTIHRYTIPYHLIRYEYMENDLYQALIKLFPDHTKEDLLSLIQQEWNPRNVSA